MASECYLVMTGLLSLHILTSLSTQPLRHPLTLHSLMIIVSMAVGGVDCATLLSCTIATTAPDQGPAALPHCLIGHLGLHLNVTSLDIGLRAHILMVRLVLGHMGGVTLSLIPQTINDMLMFKKIGEKDSVPYVTDQPRLSLNSILCIFSYNAHSVQVSIQDSI